jgi:RNA polymerase sigma factor (sigma-70 family)
MDDHELLRRYAQDRSQDAFRELVDRHLGMVYSAARRMFHDAHLAEEIAQGVFTTLAQKAATLSPPQVVGGWLYHTTRHLVMHTVRAEQRRREREQAAFAMRPLESNPDPDVVDEDLEPALAELAADDRDVLVLRFLESRSLREVGTELRISEDAARMRVNRALERLRAVFERRGLTVTSFFLATALASGAAGTIPPGLAAAITATALAGTITPTVTALVAVHTMNWINAKTAAALATAALLSGAATYFASQPQLERLRGDNEILMARQKKLTADGESAAAAQRASDNELARLRKDTVELMRLRGEVVQLRREAEAAKPARSTGVAGAPVPDGQPGAYVSKDQLALVGYDTPENALQSVTWALIKGSFEQLTRGASPELGAGASITAKDAERFYKEREATQSLFKGMRILARKQLGDDRVELKVNLDYDPIPGEASHQPPVLIQPMVKIGNEWKLGGSTTGHQETWEQDGQIKTFAP